MIATAGSSQGDSIPVDQHGNLANASERPALVLLAGLLCDETIWQEVATCLADIADVRVFSFPAHHSIIAMAEEVLSAAPDQFALAGHSMGGRVALEIMRAAPERVERLALLNTGVQPPMPTEPQKRGELVQLAKSEGMGALADVWLPPMVGKSGTADNNLMNRLRAMVMRASPISFSSQVKALLGRPDAAAVLPTISGPLLFLSGNEDSWSPLSQHHAMRAAARHGRVVEIANAGHMTPVEQPDAVVEALRTWLTDPKDGDLQ